MLKEKIPTLLVAFVIGFAPISPLGSSIVQAKTGHHISYRSIRSYNTHAMTNPIQLPAGTEKSSNWAGYAVTALGNSLSYNNVSGSWAVPIAYGASGSLGAQWIGLGGYNSSDLLQLGTIEEMSQQKEVVELFWEKLPAAAQNVGSVPVGSKITTKIAKSKNGIWALTFYVVTPKGQRITKVIKTNVDTAYVQGMGSSAEWISEDPSDGNGNLYPLANTGTVQYTNATANSKPISTTNNSVHPLAVADSSSKLLLIPSNLLSNKKAFYTKNAEQQSMRFNPNLKRYHFRISHHYFHFK